MRKAHILFLLITIVPSLLYSQITGKIKGKVTDAQSNEAIIGANVIVAGTSMGNATNVDGEFVILNVPAGVYSIKASYIGYQAVTITNVEVLSGKTTEANFKLTAEGVEVKTVEIVGERPLVQKDQATTSRFATQEDL